MKRIMCQGALFWGPTGRSGCQQLCALGRVHVPGARVVVDKVVGVSFGC